MAKNTTNPMKKVINYFFPKKENEQIIKEKAQSLVNELFLVGFNSIEIALIIDLSKSYATERMEQDRILFLSKVQELTEAQKILKK